MASNCLGVAVIIASNIFSESNKSAFDNLFSGIYEGIDLATLISLVGGPQQGANLKKTRIYREIPDENGQLVYYVNLEDFFKNGDRKNFIKIKPNDTIIIPQSPMSYFLTQVGTFNTVLSLLNLYFQLVK